ESDFSGSMPEKSHGFRRNLENARIRQPKIPANQGPFAGEPCRREDLAEAQIVARAPTKLIENQNCSPSEKVS
ncbi:MAG: hypothetical protein ACI4JZ_02215, partial [Oscillospiraceae bacterium]